MPWTPLSLMSQRLEFVRAVLHRPPGHSIRDVCRTTGITEKTGHKWLQRYGADGPAGLADRSHAPHLPAHQVPVPLVAAILALREAEPSWGGRKLRDVLRREQPTHPWPAASTITTLLKRAGLVTGRRRSARARAAWAHTTLTPAHAGARAERGVGRRLQRGVPAGHRTVLLSADNLRSALTLRPRRARAPRHRQRARAGPVSALL